VIRRPPIYLFDDAFSALDTRTDAAVRTALSSVATEATVIIVAQRISTIIQADQVIVIDDGRVVGAGTHQQLLAECPAYAELAESQSLAGELA
jgi:ATP-binding cassette subfamily B protein